MIRNERGMIILPFAIVVAIVIAIIFFEASQKVTHVAKRYSSSVGLTATQTIAEELAQKIRFAYDNGRAAVQHGTNCVGGSTPSPIFLVPSNIPLCIYDPSGKLCVLHPRDGHLVCVGPNAEITAKIEPKDLKREPLTTPLDRLFSPSTAYASIDYAPPPPPLADVNVALTDPTCRYEPGLNCKLTCGSANVDCISFKFCPLTSALPCGATDYVVQTVAFPKANLNGL